MLIVSHAEQWEKIRTVGTRCSQPCAPVITDDDDVPSNPPGVYRQPGGLALAQWLDGAAQRQRHNRHGPAG